MEDSLCYFKYLFIKKIILVGQLKPILCFQDSLGGLEVQTLDGNQWAKAPPIEDTIVVNIGDLLQFWSGGRYRATSHRVIVDGQNCKEARYSIAAFIHPNHDTPIKPFHDHVIRGSQQKKSALEHIKQRFSETYLNWIQSQ